MYIAASNKRVLDFLFYYLGNEIASQAHSIFEDSNGAIYPSSQKNILSLFSLSLSLSLSHFNGHYRSLIEFVFNLHYYFSCNSEYK